MSQTKDQGGGTGMGLHKWGYCPNIKYLQSNSRTRYPEPHHDESARAVHRNIAALSTEARAYPTTFKTGRTHRRRPIRVPERLPPQKGAQPTPRARWASREKVPRCAAMERAERAHRVRQSFAEEGRTGRLAVGADTRSRKYIAQEGADGALGLCVAAHPVIEYVRTNAERVREGQGVVSARGEVKAGEGGVCEDRRMAKAQAKSGV
ncbi:hypothetical protein C8J57DRAFT_1593276, partial [Mycena rebaudengoi]